MVEAEDEHDNDYEDNKEERGIIMNHYDYYLRTYDTFCTSIKDSMTL